MTAMPEPVDALVEAARQWYDAGYCVVPAHEDGGKRPFAGWKEFQQQRPEWAYVEGLLRTGKFTGIGVICGAVSGNVEMIEIEGPAQAAIERLDKVMAASTAAGMNDLVSKVARGCVEQSGGGGLHMFARVTDGPAKGNTKLAHIPDDTQPSGKKGVSETRGEGGFVIVAPTPGRKGHEPGASYLFLNGTSPAGTVDITSHERDELHDLITYALNEVWAEPEPEPAPAPIASPVPASTYDGLSAFDDFRARVTWREILEPAGWTWSHRDAERDYWVRPGKKVADGHSASTIEDGPLVNFSTNVDWPTEQGLSKAQVWAYLHHGGDLSSAAKAMTVAGYGEPPAPYSIPEWEAQLDPDASEEEKQEARAEFVEERFPLVNWREVWEKSGDIEWFAEPIVAAGRLVAIYSAPKAGKSLLMLEIAAAIATGRSIFGNPPMPPQKVLYVDHENVINGDIVERLESMGYGPDDLDNLDYLSFPVMGTLDSVRGGDELLSIVEHRGSRVVVIDTASRTISGDENDNSMWLAWYRNTGLKLKRIGVALVRLDHSGKDESKGQRGASAKSGDVDAVWKLTASDNIVDLYCEAQRFPIAENRLTLKRETEGILVHKRATDDWKKRRDEVFAKLHEAKVPKGATPAEALRLLKEAGFGLRKSVITKRLMEAYAERPDTWDELTVLDRPDE